MTQKSEFSFRTPTDVTLTHVNFRKELHGDDHRQAVDLNMSVDVPNSLLDTIVPGLREALYTNHDVANGQAEIEDLPATLPNLRFPRLNGGKFSLDDKKAKLAGYELEVEYGLNDERSKMVFDCVKVVKRSIETKEGGTIHLSWQCQYMGDRLDQETCGKLALLEQDLIAIRLIPPAVEQLEETHEPMENPFPVQDADEPPLTAGDIFASGPSSDGGAADDADQDAVLSSDDR
ncbi:hypothetical protein LJR074_002164 [Acidovorax sp. LjRoot74]|uniref:hypothetical protein n=1 Tax=Acidovorax sp. LjRoot74 TaxID=3342337 RepID=UPI003ECF2AE1